MGTTSSSFETGPPSFDLERPVLFYEDLESEGKLELDNETQMTPIGEKLLQLYLSGQLPSAELFWADSVRDDAQKQSQCFAILGQLYELFLTPHMSVLTPNNYSCSYLKLFESHFDSNENIKLYFRLFFQFCELNLSNVFIYTEPVYLSYNSRTRNMMHDFHLAIRDCFYSKKDAMVIPIIIIKELDVSVHVTFLALKKTNEQPRRFDLSYPNTRKKTLQFVYIDPHGLNMSDTFYSEKRFVNSLLLLQLNSIFPGYYIRETNFDCPQLQDQENNCAQWFFYNLYTFLKNSDAVTHMNTIRNLRKPAVNLHLFEMAFFFKFLPSVNIQSYHNHYFSLVQSDLQHFLLKMKHICVDDLTVRKQYLNDLGVENCAAESSCPQPCARCGSTCNFQSAVKLLEDNECKPLSPKMIAKKMLYLYAELRKIAGQDPSVVTPKAIEQQLNYEEPKTLQDLQRLYKFTDDNLNRVLNWTPGSE